MTVESAASRLGIEQCNEPLGNGKFCVHVKDAPTIKYEECPDRKEFDAPCSHGYAGDKPHRHSHTWQHGDAKILDIDDKLIDMETGEVVGRTDFGTEAIIAEIKAERATWTREQVQEHALRVLEGMYGFKIPKRVLPVPAYDAPPENVEVNYHHHANSGWSYGTGDDGHNYERNPYGTVRRIYSQNQRKEAIELAEELGVHQASQTLDIPAGTIQSWIARSR